MWKGYRMFIWITLFIVFIVFGMVSYVWPIAGWAWMYSHDDNKARGKIAARLILLFPIWPIIGIVLAVIYSIKGIKCLIKMAKLNELISKED